MSLPDDPRVSGGLPSQIITGYSDLTALHLAVARKARLVTFHSPIAQSNLYRQWHVLLPWSASDSLLVHDLVQRGFQFIKRDFRRLPSQYS